MTESLLLALHSYHLAATLGRELREQTQRDALERMHAAVGELAELPS